VYDTRAHGDSTAKRGYYTAKERDELIELMDMLVLPARVVLLGCSMGAVISISAAGELKQRVAGIIADGAYRRPMEPIIGYMWKHRWPPYPFVWPVDWHLRFWLRKYQPFDRVKQIKNITCPLLVLHGTADPVCRFQSAKELAQEAPTESTLVAFEDAGHLDLAKKDRQKYIDSLQNFFEKIGIRKSEVKSQESESKDNTFDLLPETSST
jgi:pimeloyl-ACP methyl ester carboxylesterase